MNNKICVIGGSGFIGTNLCKRFELSKIEYIIVDKRESQIFPGKTRIADVRDIEALDKEVYGDVIVNLAAEHRDDVSPRSLYWDVNVGGAKNVCQIAEKKGINRIIFTSSVAVYGFTINETGENGELNPFNDYGKTKLEAEKVYIEWQKKEPEKRTLVIIRPTVVFGEGNRGNVYNLLRQIADGKFIMVGDGKNIKSMAYVGNVSAFIEYTFSFDTGIHIYNYIDKPDFDMNTLVKTVYHALGKDDKIKIRVPYFLGYTAGKLFDLASSITGKKYPISSIRVKKFCSNTFFSTKAFETGFKPPFTLYEGLNRTIQYEFLNKDNKEKVVFYTE